MVGKPPVRLPAPTHSAAAEVPRAEPQEAVLALSKGAAVGAQAQGSQASTGHASAARSAARAKQALEPQLRLRQARQRAELPHPRRGG